MKGGKYKAFICVMLAAMVGGGIRAGADKLLIPMDVGQTDHLKAYGVAYHAHSDNITLDCGL